MAMLARRVLCGKTLATNCFKTLRATTSNAHIVRQQIRCFSRGTTLLAGWFYRANSEVQKCHSRRCGSRCHRIPTTPT